MLALYSVATPWYREDITNTRSATRIRDISLAILLIMSSNLSYTKSSIASETREGV